MVKAPVRRCIACRQVEQKAKLLRFVWSEQEVVWDVNKALPGRGAYLHRKETCWSKVVDQRLWVQAFRLSGVQINRDCLVRLTELLRKEIEGIHKPTGLKSKKSVRL